jgi:hypothetical protein
MLKINLILISILLLISCKDVENLINPTKAPELDQQGIVFSSDRVAPRDTVIASIRATNPEEGPLEYEWSRTGGSFIEPSDKDSVQWIAPLTGGTYNLKVKVSNSSRKSSETNRNITVISATEPLVDITEPAGNGYFVLYQEISVQARAEHENGIAGVSLFVNDSLVGQMSDQAKPLYTRSFKTKPAMVGKTVIKVQAEGNNHKTGSDHITINIQGIIPGKNGR